MILWDDIAPILVLYLASAVLVPFLFRFIREKTFLVAALAPALMLAWTVAHTDAAFAPPASQLTQTIHWVAALDLQIAFRLDPLSYLMLVIVNLVGALILVYSSGYFRGKTENLPQFIGAFVGFGAAMSGLVLADHTMMIYLFWELTTFCSFLLIGHHSGESRSRASARKAILVTTAGSLAMFAGFTILGLMPGGSFTVSELVQTLIGRSYHSLALQPGWVFTALVLVVIGAATKSALIPTHFWLPAAMVAPTPVSAFLHAAAMVKAGVYLLARLGPAFPHVPGLSRLIVFLGLGTLLLGGYRALRQTDLKLVLAYGTVSQLGLITVFLGFGTAKTYVAGLTLIAAHALFKSALFLSTGVIEKMTDTRDLSRLCGLGKRAPHLAVVVALAAVSMAGVPISTGFLAKEAGLTGLADAAGLLQPGLGVGGSVAIGSWLAVLALLGVVLGSALTVAYTLRYFWGAFAHKHEKGAQCPHEQKTNPIPKRLWLVPGVLAVTTVGLGFPYHRFGAFITPSAFDLAGGEKALLHLWSGIVPASLTAVIIALGLLAFYFRPEIARFQRGAAFPKRFSADAIYEAILSYLEYWASRLTGWIQTGSLPVDLSIVFTVTLLAGLGAALAGVELPSQVMLADTHSQIMVSIATIIAAGITVFSRRRLQAVLALSATGAGVVALFIIHGAPDLALTQLVVEAVTLVVFLLVLRRLPAMFSRRPERAGTYFRAFLAMASGLGIVLLGLISSHGRIHEPISQLLPFEASAFGGGNNLVNVVLVDVRAWDTVGEISVLLAAATGVTALVYLRALRDRLEDSPRSRRWRIRREAAGRRLELSQALASRRAQNSLPVPLLGTAETKTGLNEETSFVEADRLQEDETESIITPPNLAEASGKVELRPMWLTTTALVDPRWRSIVLEVSVRLLFHTLILVSIWLLLIGHNQPGGGFSGGVVAGIALTIRYFAGGRWELAEAAPVNPGRVLGLGLFVAVASALAPAFFGNSVLQSTLFDLDLGWLGTLHVSTAIGLDVGVYILVIGVVMDLLSALGSEIDRQGEVAGQQVPEIGFDDPHAHEFTEKPTPVSDSSGQSATTIPRGDEAQ